MFLKQLLRAYPLKFKTKRVFKKEAINRRKSWNKISFMGKTSLFLVSGYQAVFSLWMGGGCRFYPSCSHYAELAYQNHSFFKASTLVLKRLLSCHPLGPRWKEEPEIQKLLGKK